MDAARSHKLQTILAFFAIYIIWGSTFLAIRIAVATVPPFLAAGCRFTLAGVILVTYSMVRRVPAPTAVEWGMLGISAAILFVPSYGALFWAERIVPSGIASAIAATIPMWMAIMEVFVLRQARLRWELIASLVFGIGGVSILTVRGTSGGSQSVLPYVVLLLSQITWCIGTLLTKNMRLPASKPLVAGAQMGIGGLLLLMLSASAGELHELPAFSAKAVGAILYLTVFGSVIAFTAYLWLLAHMPATTVSSYAYVNPVVAIALGFWLGHESLDSRVFSGALLVLVGVALILRTKRETQPQRVTSS